MHVLHILISYSLLYFPMYEIGSGWILPAIVGGLARVGISKVNYGEKLFSVTRVKK
ncbi:hypothetical protein HNP21_005287 [Bacillus aryabhattai]|nr:hypothetical protein [Priestia aryabhattai]